MIKYLNPLFISLLVLVAACNKSEKETPNGMKYQVLETGDGKLAEQGEVVVFDYLMKDSNDSTWSNTFEDGVPAASMIGDSARFKQEDGMTQMFRYLSVGDSVSVTMTTKKFFRDLVKAPLPPKVDSAGSLNYVIKVRSISSVDDYFKNREGMVNERDAKNIDKYLKENNLTAQNDSSGLKYILHNNEGGQKPSTSNCVEVKYRGKFLKTGVTFDQADRVAFPLDRVIPGWQLGIPLLGKGDSATLFIPSKLAYGQQGIPGAIPPDAVLMFNVTLLDVKDGFDPQTRSCK